MLICGGDLTRDDGGRAFAFKLHQFIGQGRALFATLEAGRSARVLPGGPGTGGRRAYFRPDQVLPAVRPGLLSRAADRHSLSAASRGHRR